MSFRYKLHNDVKNYADLKTHASDNQCSLSILTF